MSWHENLLETRNFDALEVIHRVSSFPGTNPKMLAIAYIAMGYLQSLRDALWEKNGREIRLTVGSGFRDKAYNASLKNASPTSAHMWRWTSKGEAIWAVDIRSDDLPLHELYRQLKDLVRGETYVHQSFGFVHISPMGPDEEWVE